MEEENIQKKTDTMNTLLLMANAGRKHEGEKQTAKNKVLFNKDTAISHAAGHVVVHHGHAEGSIKTWANNGFKSGLQQNNATALCLSSWSLVKALGFKPVKAGETRAEGKRWRLEAIELE